MYEQGFGRGKALHVAAAQRQIEIIKQNDEIIRLLSQVVRLLEEEPER
jgi:hypothetical protein